MIQQIEAVDVCKSYNRAFSLRVSLNLQRGRIYALVGPNGSGKSTLLRILSLNERPDSGEIIYTVGGKDLRNPYHNMDIKRRVILVPTRSAIFNETVYENVAYPLRLRGFRGPGARQRVEEVLHLVGLADRMHLQARRLSAGEAQRLALARALVAGPEVLFLDEPTVSLDPENTEIIEETIRGYISKREGIVVIVTHNLFQAKRLSEEVYFLYRGRILEHQPTEVFLTRPVSEAGRRFLNGEIY